MRGSKRPAFLWVLLWGGVSGLAAFGTYVILFAIVLGPGSNMSESSMRTFVEVARHAATTFTTAILGYGLATLGLVRASGQEMRFRKFFLRMRGFPLVLLVGAVMAVVMAALQQIDMVAYWVVYVLGFAASFWYYFVIDRKADVYDAVVGSVRLVGRNFWGFLGATLVVAAWLAPALFVTVLAAMNPTDWNLAVATLVLLIWSIWWAPFTSILMGVIYRDAEGIEGNY